MTTAVLSILLATLTSLQTTRCQLGTPPYFVPRTITRLSEVLEPHGWRPYQHCRAGSRYTVMFYNEANSRHLLPGEPDGPSNNLIVGVRTHGAHEELAIERRFAESSGDIGICPVDLIAPSFVLYTCLRGDGPSSTNSHYLLRW